MERRGCMKSINKINKVIIVRPYGYYGGTLVLDLLCRLLREKGIDARLFYIPDYPKKDTNLKKFWKEWLHDSCRFIFYHLFHSFFDRSKSKRAFYYRKKFDYSMKGLKTQYLPFFRNSRTVVVYPEVVYGNFLSANNVVRWLLYFNRYQDDPTAFGKNDLVICYRKVFNDLKLNPMALQVRLVSFDNNRYKQYNFGHREGNCYILRKGRDREDLPTNFDGPVIDYGTSDEDIVRILNEKEYCFSYDTQTFYTTVAAVCGCIPIIVLEKGKTKDDFIVENENCHKPGVAYGNSLEEIEYARNTRELLLQSLDFSKINEEGVDNFIKYINNKFNFR